METPEEVGFAHYCGACGQGYDEEHVCDLEEG